MTHPRPGRGLAITISAITLLAPAALALATVAQLTAPAGQVQQPSKPSKPSKLSPAEIPGKFSDRFPAEAIPLLPREAQPAAPEARAEPFQAEAFPDSPAAAAPAERPGGQTTAMGDPVCGQRGRRWYRKGGWDYWRCRR